MEQLTVDIVTPYRRLVERAKTSSLKLPSALGELEILPGHTELLTILGTGKMEFDHNGKKRKFAVSYGFVEVNRNHVMVLAETCEEAHEINLERALAAQKSAQDKLGSTLSDNAFKKYQNKLQRALIRQQTAKA